MRPLQASSSAPDTSRVSGIPPQRPSEIAPNGGARMTEARDPMERFADWLRELNMLEGSDLHIKPGSPPLVRAGADLRRLDCEPVTDGLTTWLASKLVPENRRERFERDGAADF